MNTESISFLLYLKYVNTATLATIESMLNQQNISNYAVVIIKDKNIVYDINNEYLEKFGELMHNPKIFSFDITSKNDNQYFVCEVNAWSYGVTLCKTKYISFVQNGDICTSTRLYDQFKYMKYHENDVMISSSIKYQYDYNRVDNFDQSSIEKYSFGTTCINIENFKELDFIFEPYWEGMFFDRFLLYCIDHGKAIYTTPHIVATLHEPLSHEIDFIKHRKKHLINLFKTRKKVNDVFTFVIPFKNEGIEIEKTVASIRATTDTFTQIVLINDTSNDNYDYADIANRYNCIYHENKENLGVAGSRDYGIFNLVTTPYFIILDGHMRFYEIGWDKNIFKLIKKYPDDILCSASKEMTKDKQFYYNENGRYMIDNCIGTVLSEFPEWKCDWNNKDHFSTEEVISIPCVLGACYIASVEHWKKIGGLKFLEKYGLDEQMMSIKNWMLGYKNLYIYNWGVGHFYKINEGQNTLAGLGNHIAYNNIMMTYLFNESHFEEHINEYVEKKHIDRNAVLEIFKKHANDIDIYKEEFFKNAKYTLEDYLEFNKSFINFKNNKTIIILGGTNELVIYLKRGYTVISFEPNKFVYFRLYQQLKSYIDSGQLLLFYECVWTTSGETKEFYLDVNHMEYGSLNKDIAGVVCNNKEDLCITLVKTISLNDILKQFKNPEMLRISINGYEKEILKSIDKDLLPKYLTIPTEFNYNKTENNNVLDILNELGYKEYHLFESENMYSFDTTLDKKTKWVNYNMIKMIDAINKKMFFTKNPRLQSFYYRNCVHCKL